MPTLDGCAGRDRRAQDLAALRRELLSVPRHADPALAGLCAVRPVRHRRAADARQPPTRTTTRSPNCSQRDDYRPRALFERFNIEAIATTEGALDDLQWHAMIRDSGWAGPRRHRLSAGRGGRSRFRGLCRQSRPAGRDHRLRHRHLGTAISTRTASAAPSSRSSARPRPTTATRPPRPPTFRDAAGRGAVRPHPPARPTPTSASSDCSARRC